MFIGLDQGTTSTRAILFDDDFPWFTRHVGNSVRYTRKKDGSNIIRKTSGKPLLRFLKNANELTT